MEIIIGLVIAVTFIILFSKMKKTNQALNDSYPFNPRDYNPTERK